MSLLNVTRGVILAKEVTIADTFKTRFIGLMGTPSLPKNKALLLKPCASVHSFFMRYPIDVVFLDDENRILRVLHSLRPFRFSPLVRGAKVVLELPPGRCSSSGTRVGDLIKLT